MGLYVYGVASSTLNRSRKVALARTRCLPARTPPVKFFAPIGLMKIGRACHFWCPKKRVQPWLSSDLLRPAEVHARWSSIPTGLTSIFSDIFIIKP